MTIRITQERPDTPDAMALITELDAHLTPLYPMGSRHGLSVAKLLDEKVAFFVLRYQEIPAGCGGLQCHGTEYAEIKRMYIRPQFRGKGLAKAMLGHLETYALRQGIRTLHLETGIFQPEAMGLYERLGYYRIGPFGMYREDPLSVYYEKVLN